MGDVTKVKTDNGKIYIRGNTIVGRKVIEGDRTTYYRGNQIHREGGPAVIYTTYTGIVCTEYYINDKLHNETGPAMKDVRPDGLVTYEAYMINGEYHRIGEPAIIRRSDNNIIEEYWENGKRIQDCCRRFRGNSEKELAAVCKERDNLRDELGMIKFALDHMREERDDALGRLKVAEEELAAAQKIRDELQVKHCAVIAQINVIENLVKSRK